MISWFFDRNRRNVKSFCASRALTTLFAFATKRVIKAACCTVSAFSSVVRIGIPSLFTIMIPLTPNPQEPVVCGNFSRQLRTRALVCAQFSCKSFWTHPYGSSSASSSPPPQSPVTRAASCTNTSINHAISPRASAHQPYKHFACT